jgi:uncharacterized protein YciI
LEFDRFSVVLLRLRPDAPQLDEDAAAMLQDAHLTHLAALHEDGHLLAAGPLAYDDPAEELCGLSLFAVEPGEALALAEQDPAVRAGRFAVSVLPWMVPAGAASFSRTRFPHSVAEAMGD